MAKIYPVNCVCGKTHDVPSTEAGRKLSCPCGKQIEIPTLRELKQSVGESTASAEVEIAAKLADKTLPEETECILCHAKTQDCAYSKVDCESQETVERIQGLQAVLLFGVFGIAWRYTNGLIASIFSHPSNEVIHGRDVAFRLPLRVCKECQKTVNRSQAKELLLKIPLYGRLLQKYPHAAISKIQSP